MIGKLSKDIVWGFNYLSYQTIYYCPDDNNDNK